MSMPRAVIVTGGIYHDFAAIGDFLSKTLAEAGFAVDLHCTVAEGLTNFIANPGSLLVLHALSFSMVQHEKYAPYRAQYAYSPPAPVQAALIKHLARGGGILGLHTASICFDTWPTWNTLLGVEWVWGVSYHPPPGPVTVIWEADPHPLTHGLPNFALTDELYCSLRVAEDARVLARARAEENAELQPVVIIREKGAGRVVYSALGHDVAALAVPAYRAFLERAARWAGKVN